MRTRITATWLAFLSATALALPQPPNPWIVLLSAVVGAVLIYAGFAAAERCRPLPQRPPGTRLTLAAISLLAGTALGFILLGALILLARAEPALRARFANRLHEPWWRPWALAYESSILEEVVFRLVILTLVAWATLRITKNARLAFIAGLVASTIAFGLAHLPAWLAATHATPLLVAAVMTLNALGAILLGFVYWRWGLPYAIVAHFAGDMVIQVLGPRVVG